MVSRDGGTPVGQHPSWCDPSTCSLKPDGSSGSHYSAPIVFGPNDPAQISAQIWLFRGNRAATAAMVEFHVPRCDAEPGPEEFGIVLLPEQLSEFGYLLRRVADVARQS